MLADGAIKSKEGIFQISLDNSSQKCSAPCFYQLSYLLCIHNNKLPSNKSLPSKQKSTRVFKTLINLIICQVGKHDLKGDGGDNNNNNNNNKEKTK